MPHGNEWPVPYTPDQTHPQHGFACAQWHQLGLQITTPTKLFSKNRDEVEQKRHGHGLYDQYDQEGGRREGKGLARLLLKRTDICHDLSKVGVEVPRKYSEENGSPQ